MKHYTLAILTLALATSSSSSRGQATTEPSIEPATAPVATESTTAPAATLPAVPHVPQPTGKGSFNERYGVLIDRNIFLAERRRPRPTNTRPSGPSTPVAETFVIRGIVLEGLDFRAYVESSRGGPMTRLAPGDTMARGKVVEIQPDAVLFALDGQVTWVEIGHDLLSGKRMVVTAAAPTTSVATSTQPAAPGATAGTATIVAPAATPGAAPAAGVSSIEERMRRARSRRNTGGGQ